MVGVANAVGARKVVAMLLGEDQAVRWGRPVLRFWGFLFLGFVCLFVWLPGRKTSAGSPVLLWIASYTTYLLLLEILGRKQDLRRIPVVVTERRRFAVREAQPGREASDAQVGCAHVFVLRQFATVAF